ncbi:hypothetical protein HYV86_02315 [Candidatus Woesearchaeota archaeon]|nr:hypothetical protein [Candidatus Woesearchaeota archaeon]
MSRSKSFSWWKWALLGIGLYLVCVVLTILVWAAGSRMLDANPTAALPWWRFVVAPLMLISFYPGLLIVGNYEVVWLIIPLNILFYGGVSMGVGFLVNRLRNNPK